MRRGRAFGRQVGWSFASKLVSALLQMVVLILLARGLAPAGFAFASSVNAALTAFAALNGMGLMRQIQYRRSLDKTDGLLGPLFAKRLKFTYISAATWVAACALLGLATRDGRFIAVMPAAIWLVAEQTTTIWNSISIVDARNQALMPSYLYRRVPVVIALVAALIYDWDIIWSWTIGLAFGSCVAYINGWRLQESWAKVLWPWRREHQSERLQLDFGFWWFEVGTQIRDLDVPAIAFFDPYTAGIYAFPARLIRPMNLVTQSIGSVAFPVLARRKLVTLPQLLLGVTCGMIPVLLVSAGVAVMAPLIPRLLGPAYLLAVEPMQILCLAATLTGAISLLSVFLQARSSSATRFAGYAALLTGLMQIVFAAIGAVWGGPVGAAWGAVVAQLIFLALLSARALAQCRLESRTAHANGLSG